MANREKCWRCEIQWIDSRGNPTPDDNAAVGVVQCFTAGDDVQTFLICEEHAKRLPIQGWTFRRFAATPAPDSFGSWAEVVEHVSSGGAVLYHAPLDTFPRAVRVRHVFKNGKLRIDPLSRDADCFTADAGHLSRFRRA